MRRTELKRKAWMPRGKPLKARSGFKPRTKRMPAHRYRTRAQSEAKSLQDYGTPAFRKWIHGLHCVVPDYSPRPTPCVGIVQECHIKTRATGGEVQTNVFPACVQHHTEQGKSTPRFESRYGLALRGIAKTIAAEWRQRQ